MAFWSICDCLIVPYTCLLLTGRELDSHRWIGIYLVEIRVLGMWNEMMDVIVRVQWSTLSISCADRKWQPQKTQLNHQKKTDKETNPLKVLENRGKVHRSVFLTLKRHIKRATNVGSSCRLYHLNIDHILD